MRESEVRGAGFGGLVLSVTMSFMRLKVRCGCRLTEQRAINSKVNADGICAGLNVAAAIMWIRGCGMSLEELIWWIAVLL